jgi:prepilin-type N-terminal cleavage/methylation domain-containing protein
MKKQARSGFTIIELLVVVSIIALLIGILLPALGRARDSALQTTSLSNLRQISAGLAAYAGDWNDRQPTLIPDDFCQADGNDPSERCADYINRFHCMPQPILGWANIGGGRALWGYWIDEGGECAGVGGCGNVEIAMPYDCELGNQAGFFRVMNHKLFAQYMNDRYYDEVFFAPKDRRKREKVEEFFDLPDEFSSDQGIIEWPSYCMAASAMIAPDVASGQRCEAGQDPEDCPDDMCNPCDFPGGFRSPPVGAAAYPDLKMRCWEHEWLQNNPAELNPAFTTETPYYFNHSPQSAPATLMFDGSVRIFSANEAIQSSQRVEKQGGCQLWINDWCGNNYFELGSHGFPEERTSFGVLTRDGIKGKDTIGLEG